MAAEAPAPRPQLTPRDLVLTLRDLPSPPEAYYALNRLLDQPHWDLCAAAAVVEAEPALAARVLRVANSPYYGLSRRVGDIGQAVRSIGSLELRNLVLVTTMLASFSHIPSEVISCRHFWLRGLRVAVNAHLLCERGPRAELAGELFVAGLLHDIGSLLTCLKLPELARKALLYRPDGPAGAVFSIERAVLRCADAAVGGELIRHWRLPRLLELAVGNHPVPEQSEEHAEAAAVVQLALWMAAAQEQGLSVDSYLDADDPLWDLAGVPAALAKELVEPAETRLRAALALFEV